MKYAYLIFALAIFACTAKTPKKPVAIVQDNTGMRLVVEGNDFMINGMNWDYFPIGTTYSYSLWEQPEEIIKQALNDEMTLLKNIGVNAIRVYTGIPPKWLKYIYENYGIYTMINHSFGRYGLTLEGKWVANTNYADPRVRDILFTEVTEMVNLYRGTPGLLLYLLGNENNYGLFWEGAETENIPDVNGDSTAKARALYKLFNEATIKIKSLDHSYPVAICNGDLQFIEIIAEECPDIDILGTNMYRGSSFGDAFEVVQRHLGKPLMFTEFGADAYDANKNAEDQEAQASYILTNWEEIYQNAAGLGKVGNSIGGFTFQFSDGWWKFDQTNNLEIHDTYASWANGGYGFDFQEGINNMNEEWFGICAKGPTNDQGLYSLEPRIAYFVLREVHKFNPYAATANPRELSEYFSSIEVKANPDDELTGF